MIGGGTQKWLSLCDLFYSNYFNRKRGSDAFQFSVPQSYLEQSEDLHIIYFEEMAMCSTLYFISPK